MHMTHRKVDTLDRILAIPTAEPGPVGDERTGRSDYSPLLGESNLRQAVDSREFAMKPATEAIVKTKNHISPTVSFDTARRKPELGSP